jgi:trigger factor
VARLLSAEEGLMEDIIKVEDISNIEKRIHIHVNSDTVNQKFEEFFSSIRKEAHIPGFRKGKAPASMLKKYFKSRAQGAISQMLISEYYQNAIRDYNINPIGNPIVENAKDNYPGEFKNDNSYDIELVVEVLPSVDPVGYDDIDITKPDLDTNDLIDKKILEYQNQFAEREQINDTPTKLGDSVIIDFKGFLDGKPFEGGEAEGFSIETLGSNVLIPGFEEQVVGLCPGESKEINVKFPEQYSAAHLANKDAKFNVTLHSVIRKTPAKVDDDLALMVGFDSVDSFKENIEKQVLSEMDNTSRGLMESVISAKLIENNDFDVPKSLVKQEAARILKQNNISNPSEQILDHINKSAVNNIKKAILLEAIYEKENIEVTLDELNVHLEEQAKVYNQEKDEIVSMLHNTNQMDSFMSVIRSKKVVDHIISLNTKEVEKDNE